MQIIEKTKLEDGSILTRFVVPLLVGEMEVVETLRPQFDENENPVPAVIRPHDSNKARTVVTVDVGHHLAGAAVADAVASACRCGFDVLRRGGTEVRPVPVVNGAAKCPECGKCYKVASPFASHLRSCGGHDWEESSAMASGLRGNLRRHRQEQRPRHTA